MFKRILLTALSIVFGASLVTTPAFADDEAKPSIWLQISPVSNRVTLEPNQSLEYTFNVENIGSEAFGYHVYAAPYSVTNETYEVNFANETPRTQITRWITFKNSAGEFVSDASFTINPGEKHTIEYRIAVPADVPQGGQYATIFAESDPSKDVTSSGIKTVSRVGLIIYGRTAGETDDRAEITDYHLDRFLTSGNITTGALVKNEGNTDFETNYSLLVKSLFGKTVYEKANVYDVLPDTSRRINMEWDGTPAFGIFRVTASVTALDKVTEETKIVLIMPIFVLIIAILLLTILVVWIIILIRKRKGQKSRLIV